MPAPALVRTPAAGVASLSSLLASPLLAPALARRRLPLLLLAVRARARASRSRRRRRRRPLVLAGAAATADMSSIILLYRCSRLPACSGASDAAPLARLLTVRSAGVACKLAAEPAAAGAIAAAAASAPVPLPASKSRPCSGRCCSDIIRMSAARKRAEERTAASCAAAAPPGDSCAPAEAPAGTASCCPEARREALPAAAAPCSCCGWPRRRARRRKGDEAAPQAAPPADATPRPMAAGTERVGRRSRVGTAQQHGTGVSRALASPRTSPNSAMRRARARQAGGRAGAAALRTHKQASKGRGGQHVADARHGEAQLQEEAGRVGGMVRALMPVRARYRYPMDRPGPSPLQQVAGEAHSSQPLPWPNVQAAGHASLPCPTVPATPHLERCDDEQQAHDHEQQRHLQNRKCLRGGAAPRHGDEQIVMQGEGVAAEATFCTSCSSLRWPHIAVERGRMQARGLSQR